MKPIRIFICRHGESEGNVNKEIYKTVPDYALQLTPKGWEQAIELGKKIRSIVGESSIQFYVSPFWRTRQTYAGIRQSFPNTSLCEHKYYEDARLREQEWCGTLRTDGYMLDAESEREAYGHFYYRFNGGESCADVYDRLSDFMGTMFRDFKKDDFPCNVVISGHGMSDRIFLMRFFHVSVEEFEAWSNPKNGDYFLLELQSDGKYKLMTPLRTHKVKHDFQFPWEDKLLFRFEHTLPYETESGQSSPCIHMIAASHTLPYETESGKYQQTLMKPLRFSKRR